MTDAPSSLWLKSSYSGGGGSCVEWAPARATATGIVPVRDSKVPRGPVLTVRTHAFASFVTGIKSGEFGTV
ncbi:DUF397 domain-containing protein [Streptomyces corynorhini]|uniref:DUF397 domain-containing protein n=1 Tax=Streptomyces corynorhini TaxID=2282652 RepID=A0A370BAI2_9ACTN|nr:DUF397 domain-containing protein [Streptomyces corynorhini]RDG36706.1 DUF397 domain-containing protein [Streptomyces corynorhini]